MHRFLTLILSCVTTSPTIVVLGRGVAADPARSSGGDVAPGIQRRRAGAIDSKPVSTVGREPQRWGWPVHRSFWDALVVSLCRGPATSPRYGLPEWVPPHAMGNG